LQLFAALAGVGVGIVVAGIDREVAVEVSGREGNGTSGVDGSGG
jgi:hypothetical protein